MNSRNLEPGRVHLILFLLFYIWIGLNPDFLGLVCILVSFQWISGIPNPAAFIPFFASFSLPLGAAVATFMAIVAVSSASWWSWGEWGFIAVCYWQEWWWSSLWWRTCKSRKRTKFQIMTSGISSFLPLPLRGGGWGEFVQHFPPILCRVFFFSLVPPKSFKYKTLI